MTDRSTPPPAPAAPAMPSEPRQDSRHVLWGIVLIAIGLLMLGGQLEIDAAPWGIRLNLGRLWPVILIVIGLARLVTARREGRAAAGVWLIFVGGLLLLHTYDVLRLTDSWPLFIVAGGVSIIFGDRAGRRRGC